MAFNNMLAAGWLAPGASATWWYGWGDNRGAQYATADVKTPDSLMWAIQQGERMESNGAVTYFVTFRNDGPNWCYYNLHGGSLG